MYYVDGDKLAKDRVCITPGPPSWNWKMMKGIHPENAPKTVSIDPAEEGGPLSEKTEKHIKEVDNLIARQKQEMKDSFKDAWNIFEEKQLDDYQRNQPAVSGEWQDKQQLQQEPFAPFEDAFQFDVPEMNKMIMPGIDEPIDLDDDMPKPLNRETISLIDDKEKGGKGYEMSSNVVKQLKVPNGKGFYKESRKQTGYTWNSADARPPGNIQEERK